MMSEIQKLKRNEEYRKGMVLLLPLSRGEDTYADAALAYFLRKSERVSACIEMCRNAYRVGPVSDWLKNEYALAIESLHDWETSSLPSLERASLAILKLSTFDSIRNRVCYRMAKRYAEKANYLRCLDWVNQIQEDILDRRMEKPVFLLRLRALSKNTCWREVLELSGSTAPEFRIDPFVLRYRAQALRALGDIREATALYLDQIVPLKPDWYVFGEAGELCMEAGKQEKALLYMGIALLQPGKLDMKVKVLDALGTLLGRMNMVSEGRHFSRLCAQIRKKNGWKLTEAQQDLLAGETIRFDQDVLVGCLRKGINWQKGTITNVMANGQVGFICCGDDSLFFSKRNAIGRIPKMEEGRQVAFVSIMSWDRKKGRFSRQAIILQKEPT